MITKALSVTVFAEATICTDSQNCHHNIADLMRVRCDASVENIYRNIVPGASACYMTATSRGKNRDDLWQASRLSCNAILRYVVVSRASDNQRSSVVVVTNRCSDFVDCTNGTLSALRHYYYCYYYTAHC